MLFDKGVPREQINNPEEVSLFFPIWKLSQILHIDVNRSLAIFEQINRVIVGLILSLSLSSILFVSSAFSNNRLLAVVISFIISYGYSYLIERFSERIYHPQFYNQEQMHLSDIVDKVSGPNKDWDILESKSYQLRKEIEHKIYTLFTSLVVVFITYVALLFIVNNTSLFPGRIYEDRLRDSFSSFIFYVFFLLFFNHFIYGLEKRRVPEILVDGLLMSLLGVQFIVIIVSSYIVLLTQGSI